MVCIKSRLLVGQKSAGLATWNTLNSELPQLFKDEPKRNEINHLHNEEHVSCPQTATAEGFSNSFAVCLVEFHSLACNPNPQNPQTFKGLCYKRSL